MKRPPNFLLSSNMGIVLCFAVALTTLHVASALATGDELSAARRLAAGMAGSKHRLQAWGLNFPPTTAQQPLALPPVSAEKIIVSNVAPPIADTYGLNVNNYDDSASARQGESSSRDLELREREIAVKCGPHPVKSLKEVAARTGTTVQQVLNELQETRGLMHQYINLVYRYINCVKSIRLSTDSTSQKASATRRRRSNGLHPQFQDFEMDVSEVA